MKHFLSDNIIFLRKKLGLTQTEMATSLSLKRNTLSNYETKHTEPDLGTINQIAKFFDISIDALISKDLSKTHLKGKTKEKKNEEKTHLKTHPSTHLTDFSEDETELGVSEYDFIPNIYEFETAAAAGSALILSERDKLRREPTFYLPNMGPGLHIMLTISGDSMHSTIKNGDKVVATQVTDASDLRQGQIYLILDEEDGLVCKRLYKEDKATFELCSDNEVYPPYKRPLKSLLMFFKVREVHTTDLRPYWNDLRKEMREIRTEMADIRKLLRKK